MTERMYPWEPAYGFMKTDKVYLAAALEAVRRRNCEYGSLGSQTCDCKYGVGTGVSSEKELPVRAHYPKMGSEQTGCPELRSVIKMLLHGSEDV